ncbi:MAG: UDP-N-acetylmuramoyl-L-alanine--D-glutamate ligase [Candidatus Promineifilaceae bacterium]|nr:UDP-N-acetylmuramoyl-L-alanine--D-glutamate ligase [Candidatus Promineifilaceae bacterium]
MVDAFTGKRVVVLGLARQGTAIARFAAERGARVIVSDLKSPEALVDALDSLTDLEIKTVLGGHPLTMLDGADLLVVSGGVPLDLPIIREAHARGIPVTNDSLEFARRVPCLHVGITGSAGKTTTTALTGAMAVAADYRAWIGGNIGRPLITYLPEIQAQDICIQELSSFQLELWDCSPDVAAVLNLTPNHLDRHQTMDAYKAAKANILRYQESDAVAVLPAEDPGAAQLAELVQGRLRRFSAQTKVDDGAYLKSDEIYVADEGGPRAVCAVNEIPLRGGHNVQNVLAAVTLADSVGVPVDAMRAAIVDFPGVEHRLEVVSIIQGVQYVNDSIATAPERSLAALGSFSEPVILLAGGKDKGMVWEPWAEAVATQAKAVILFGQLAEPLADLLQRTAGRLSGTTAPTLRADGLAEGLLLARSLAKPGDVVLLAPGGASFDAYQDFAARGQHFRELVQELDKARAAMNSETTNQER